jgi:hypothetical protein
MQTHPLDVMIVEGSQSDETSIHNDRTNSAPVSSRPLLRHASSNHDMSQPGTPSLGGLARRAGNTTPEETTRPNPAIPVASVATVDSWQNKVYGMNGRGQALKVTGSTVGTIADTLLALLKSHRTGIPFSPTPGVRCAESPLQSFIQRFHDIEMYAKRIFPSV